MRISTHLVYINNLYNIFLKITIYYLKYNGSIGMKRGPHSFRKMQDTNSSTFALLAQFMRQPPLCCVTDSSQAPATFALHHQRFYASVAH